MIGIFTPAPNVRPTNSMRAAWDDAALMDAGLTSSSDWFCKVDVGNGGHGCWVELRVVCVTVCKRLTSILFPYLKFFDKTFLTLTTG